MKILKNILFLVIALVAAYFTAEWFGLLYERVFGPQGGGFGVFSFSDIEARVILGIVPAYVTYLTVLFTAFGGEKKYWWVGVLLLPVLWFVIQFDLSHWYFYLGLAIVGWVIGWIISKIFNR